MIFLPSRRCVGHFLSSRRQFWQALFSSTNIKALDLSNILIKAHERFTLIRRRLPIDPPPSYPPLKVDSAMVVGSSPTTIISTPTYKVMLLEASLDACNNCCKMPDDKKLKSKSHPTLDRTKSFIRAHDLNLTDDDLVKCCEELTIEDDEQRTDDITCKSSNSSNTTITNKEILSLSGGGSGCGAIMSALVVIGIKEATDESARWSGTSSTEKILKKRAKAYKNSASTSSSSNNNNDTREIMGSWPNAASSTDVFVWSSKCTRTGHGSDYPVVKSRGLIPASAQDVVDLIKDSNRVTEYNKMSIGREDQHVLTQDLNSSIHSMEKCPKMGVPGEAKIMSSKSHPPLVRKPLEFKTLFYARQLTSEDGVEMDDNGVAYITVGRSVWETPEGTADGADTSSTRCEILLSVNLVREVTTGNGEKWCELTLISHGVSPGIPMFVGKQLALTTAENYIKDIRALFEKKK